MAAVKACSQKRPVCVHAVSRISAASLDRALDAAETTFTTLGALGLPLPRNDASRGGDGRFDVYLDANADDARALVDLGGTDPVFGGASAFGVSPPPRGKGCDGRQRVALAVAEGALLGLDEATDRSVLNMSASYLASIAEPCSVSEIEAVDTFQRAPDRCLAGEGEAAMLADTHLFQRPPRALEPQPGAFLFPLFLDERFAAQAPGTILASLFAVGQHPRAEAAFFVDEPDFFDGLRSSLKARNVSFGDTVLDFAVSRAFIGTRSDGMHLADVDRFGDLGRVRFEWKVPFGSLPRRVAPARPLDALGSTYLWLDLAGASPTDEVSFIAEWEVPFLFRWAIVKIAPDGTDAGRIDVAPVFGEYRAEKAIRDLGGVSALLIVGVNDGEWSKADPFDPGEPRLDPKGYMVTLAK